MKRILGLDLGTNSIGWALIEIDHEKGIVNIIGLGARILPMDAGEIKEFESSGKIKSSAAQRTEKRGSRKLNERYLLRRDRLHLVLNLLEALPSHYKLEIDFKNNKGEKSGQLKKNAEPKLAYLPKKKGKKADFLFKDSYLEMLKDIGSEKVNNNKGNRVPYDWTLYYLRQKALTAKISLEELAWVLLSYNQKRGYEKTEVIDKTQKDGKIIEELDLSVKEVFQKNNYEGKKYFEIHLEGNDNFIYKEFSEVQLTFKNDLKEVIKTSKVDNEGNINVKETEFKIVDIYDLQIDKVDYRKEKNKHIFRLKYKNGWIEEKPPVSNYTFKYKNNLNKSYDYIVETLYDVDGNLKIQRGKERKLREPDFSDNSSDWTLLKKKTEKEALQYNLENIGEAKKYISPQIYNTLKNDAKTGTHTKIIGGKFQVVDRDFYREELNEIIATQRQFHKNLEDKKVFEQCVITLYPKNKNHQKTLLKNKETLQHLLIEDIMLYQRPLKSKKSEISNCKYEIRYWKSEKKIDKKSGEISAKKSPVYNKVVPASHPYFQEFRIWDKLHSLKIIQVDKADEETGEIITNVDVTKDYLKNREDFQKLFDKLNNQKLLNEKQFLTFCKSEFKLPYTNKLKNYVWNFPEDEELKGNETRVSFAARFKRCGFIEYTDFLTQEKERELWHYLYSVSYKERTANSNKSLKTFLNHFFIDYKIDNGIKEKIITDFTNYPQFTSKYCSYSEKALKKLLPIINKGFEKEYCWARESWYINWKNSIEERKKEIINRLGLIDFNPNEEQKIDYTNAVKVNVDIQKGEIPFPKGLFNAFKKNQSKEDFSDLSITQASYLVYGRHSELAIAKHWTSPNDIRKQLHQELKQHSLNNPVAEKVLLEMMQVVADIWDYYGDGKENFFSKIHLEVGRELKKSAKEKEYESKRMSGNRAQNKRIRQVLEEFLAQNPYKANPKNLDHFERLKIAEEAAEYRKNVDKDFFKGKSYTKKDIDDILKKPRITKNDFVKYKLWIEQGYRSPYSGQIIKITDLFNGNKYNIDHIFPQASITNNSLNNKVVVEVELNKLKSDKTAREFIQNQNGHSYLGIPVCTEEEYVKIVKSQFSGTKSYILLSKDIPKGFTNSQMNNARHIARKAMELLSHIVREKEEVEFRSKNVLPVTGRVTSQLKRAWQLDQVWKELVSSRFIRLNELTQTSLFGDWQTAKNGQLYFDCNLDKSIREKDMSYDIKRIDHRHHSLDALIVALCTEDHVNYINNINANSKSNDFGKQQQIKKYRETLKRKIMWSRPNKENPKDKDWYFMLPGEKRNSNKSNSKRETVLEKTYHYKSVHFYGQDYKKMILSVLEDTIVTFKQNLRVINKTVNRYNSTPVKKKYVKQNTRDGQKRNWAIRRQLSKETIYGKRVINGIELRVERELLSEKFNKKKIEKVTDEGVKRILTNHLSQFDTTEVLFDEAIIYFESLFEKEEILSIINDVENDVNTINDFINHVKSNNYKYKTRNYKFLNVFVDKINERDFRNEKLANGKNKFKINEHPEIAFSPEEIYSMNNPENIKILNRGKGHMPINKIQVSQEMGKERPLSEDDMSVKSKQYVVTAAGSNLYLGFYEQENMDLEGNITRQRKFKDIGLIELIETLKQDVNKRLNPLPYSIYDNNSNEFDWKFTLSPLDLVYVPTESEIKKPSEVDFRNLTKTQIDRVYKYVDGNEDIANFVPYCVAKPIWRFHGTKNKDIFKDLEEDGKIKITEKELIQNEFGLGSQQNKNQNMIDGKTQVKKICWKLEVDRLGNIKKIIK